MAARAEADEGDGEPRGVEEGEARAQREVALAERLALVPARGSTSRWTRLKTDDHSSSVRSRRSHVCARSGSLAEATREKVRHPNSRWTSSEKRRSDAVSSA